MDQFIITESSGAIRTMGRDALSGKWVLAFVAYTVYSAAVSIPQIFLAAFFSDGTASAISWIYSILVAGPFLVGCSIFALSVFRNEEAAVGQIFYGFERFGKNLGLYLVISFFIILWALIPLAGIVLAVIAYFRYSQVFFIMADNPDLGIMECITRSKQMMAGNKAKYFTLCLSFIGWAVLASLPLVILEFFTENEPVYDNIWAAVTYMPSAGYLTATFVMSAGFFLLTAYVTVSLAAFYEMVAGYLRPGFIEAKAEIIEENSHETHE